MKSVAILRYGPHEGPGYFAKYLTRHGIPWSIVKVDEGAPLPRPHEVAGIAMMGGAMSVNDDLPWTAPVLALVRESVAADVPVIGHCLGGQLLSKALGGTVTRNPVKEIGWGEIDVIDTPEALGWSPAGRFLSYHWHGDTFSLPPEGVRIWSSPYCTNQAFVLGKHFGMQCHIEITAEMIESWCESGAEEIAEARAQSPAVQTPEEMRVGLDERLAALRVVADRVYDRWTQGLRRSVRK